MINFDKIVDFDFDFDSIGDDFQDDLLSEVLDEEERVTDHLPEKRIKKIKADDHKFMNARLQTELEKLITCLPEPGYVYHLISDASFNFYTIVPVFVSLLGTVEECYVSTWAINREGVLCIFDLFDTGKIKKLNFFVGDYIKGRKPEIYYMLRDGLTKRDQIFIESANHAKIFLFQAGDRHIVVEGSANCTSNPRTEQSIFCDSKETYEFHKSWMDEVFQEANRK